MGTLIGMRYVYAFIALVFLLGAAGLASIGGGDPQVHPRPTSYTPAAIHLGGEMPTAYRDLEIPAGGTVEFVVDVVGGPASLTGYTGRMMIRELRADDVPLAEIPAGAITVNPGTRQVTVKIPSTETSTYTWRRGVYDVVITGPTNDIWQLVQGRVTNSLMVTREEV